MKELEPALQLSIGEPLAQLRTVVFHAGGRRALLAVHSRCPSIDPWHRLFVIPTDTLKLSAFDLETGELMWRVDLGPGMIPGMWYCPVLPFDLDEDGSEEIWLVNNPDAEHPLNFDTFVLERRNASTGETTDTLPWPRQVENQSISNSFRNFLHGAYSHGRPRLIVGQGTYLHRKVAAYAADGERLWETAYEPGCPGPLGSHQFPAVDLDGDGRDELLWGERCLDIDTGREHWVADQDGWSGHSDIVMPTLDRASGQWLIYTCREAGEPNGGVVMFDARGQELWGRRGMGHMHTGWTARLCDDGGHLCYAMQIGPRPAVPGGTRASQVQVFMFDMHGTPIDPPFEVQGTMPVDFTGDGLHELVYGGSVEQGKIIDRLGRTIGQARGRTAIVGKLLDYPGEQIVTYEKEDERGTIRIYANPQANDSPEAEARYAHPYYASCRRITAVGYNRVNLGGL